MAGDNQYSIRTLFRAAVALAVMLAVARLAGRDTVAQVAFFLVFFGYFLVVGGVLWLAAREGRKKERELRMREGEAP